jgi:hypothetical protein
MEFPDLELSIEQLRERNILKLLLVSLLSIGFYFFIPKYSVIFFLIAATLAVAITTKRYEVNKLGVETATFTTVMAGAALNPQAGALIGLLTILLQVMTGSGGSYVIWVVPGYAAAGFISGILGSGNIVMNGIMISVGLQGFFGVSTAVLSPDYLTKFVPRAAATIVFNILLFQTLAEPVMSLLV